MDVMVETVQTRASGIEITNTEIENINEDVDDAEHLYYSQPVEVQIGESAGNPVHVETKYFVVMSVDMETDEQTQMMTGEEHIDEASVFISNADGEVGGGFIRIDGGDVDEAIAQLEDEYL